jgi:thiamine-monophosphate kinase
LSSLGPGGEFDLIRSFLAAGPPPGAEVLVGSGDDCAVLESGWVVSIDAFLEDVHFRRGWISFDEAGYRAVTAALSDVAAMAARPVGVLVALGLPDAEAPHIAEGIRAGIRRACERAGCALIGGDLARSPGPVVVNVVALGRAERPVLRSGARVGDEVWVTGVLGASAAAVHSWECGREPDPSLRKAFAVPVARFDEARWVAERIRTTALIDLSDGLAGDMGHIAAASGVGIVLDPALVPVAPSAASAAGSRRRALPLALAGGEDYELAFTARPGSAESAATDFNRRFDLPLTRVGIVADGAGVRLEGDGADQFAPGSAGFDHFCAPRSEAADAGRSDPR